MKWFERIRTYYILKNHAIPAHKWFEITKRLPLLSSLNSTQLSRLRVLSTLFIHRKTFFGAHNFEITFEMKIIIAAQASIEILYLGIRAFDGWKEIIIYPGAFKVKRETLDENGLVTSRNNVLSGEAWDKGPLILSWDDVERDSFALHAGHNVVIHEFAHKLDILNGRANGMPPLHPDMLIKEWTKSLTNAYKHLILRLDHHHNEINAYAAKNPAEFFAVMCEYFFTAPQILIDYYPKVYNELCLYFRQHPHQTRSN